MGRLLCRVLFSVATLLIVNADDGWRRVVEPVTGHETRARSNDPGARIPFNPEDRAAPPPWLVPPNPKHLGFPPERPKVMSFFDEEPSEFLPWPQKGPQSRSSQQPQQQPFRELPSFLQPPPAARQDVPVQQNQQPVSRQDQRQVPVYKPKPLLSPPPAALNPPPATLPPSVANLRNLPSTILANERHEEPFRPSQPAVESKQQDVHRPTAAPVAQNAPLGPSNRRKSVRPVYDSSEYDYEDEAPVAASHDKMPLNSRTDEQQAREDETDLYDDEEYYDNQKRRQSAQTTSRNKNRHQNGPEEHDYEHFDPEETIFRTQVGLPQQFPPQPPRHQSVPEPELDEAAHGREDEPYFEEELAATRPHKGQDKNAGRKQQQVPQPAQQSGRDRSPTEPSRFETERPSFKPEQRQQADADWPYRPPSPGSRKPKPKVPVQPEPEEELYEDASFESGKTKVKSTPPPPSFFAEPAASDSQKQRRPTQQRTNAEKLGNRNKPTGFDPSFDQSEPDQRAPLPNDGSSRFQQRNPHQGTGGRRAKPTPTPAPYAPASFAADEEPTVEQGYPELQRPVSERRPGQPRRPSVRPTSPKPEIVEPEPYDETDDEPLIPFSVPTPRTKPPQVPAAPQLQAPKDGSLPTKGLQTLKTLAALQSNEGKRQPVQRPQEPFQVDEKVKPEVRRPSGKRPSSNRYQPPGDGYDQGFKTQPDASYDGESKPSGARIPISDSDPIPFGFFNTPEKEANNGEDRLDSEEVPLPATPKPFGRQTTTAEPAVISDESEEKKPSALFPPFNKRTRPTPSTAAPQVAQDKSDSSKPTPNGKEPAPVLPRITSYKQRIEAMKERVRLQQQQQQQAQSKKDDDVTVEQVDVTSSTTTTTTTRKPTTRPKFPTRMPTKKAITVTSQSTTESTAEPSIEKELPTFDETRRRFKPKNPYARKPEIKDEATESDSRSSAAEENPKKDVVPKPSDHPYRRNQQQQRDRVQSEDAKQAESQRLPIRDPSKRRQNFSRTTSRPSVDSIDDAPPSPSRPSLKKPLKTLSDSNRDAESDDEPTIELVEVSSGDTQSDKQPKPFAESSEHDEPKPVLVADHFESTQEPFVEKPARSDEEDEPVIDDDVTSSGSANARERLPIFTMATNDPMLPIEELLNIRIRDDGKGM